MWDEMVNVATAWAPSIRLCSLETDRSEGRRAALTESGTGHVGLATVVGCQRIASANQWPPHMIPLQLCGRARVPAHGDRPHHGVAPSSTGERDARPARRSHGQRGAAVEGRLVLTVADADADMSPVGMGVPAGQPRAAVNVTSWPTTEAHCDGLTVNVVAVVPLPTVVPFGSICPAAGKGDAPGSRGARRLRRDYAAVAACSRAHGDPGEADRQEGARRAHHQDY